MVLVFLPALAGLRLHCRDAPDCLRAGSCHYCLSVACPLLAPSFLGCTLLLFANAFSAYATVAALLTQGGVYITLEIQNLLTRETGQTQPGLAKALALAMLVIVVIVMAP
mgnify:CR=1 FL=1